jgi:hypothetical protein
MEQLPADLWRVHSSVQDLVRFSDTKAAAILTAEGVVLGIAFANLVALLGTAQVEPIFGLIMLLSLGAGATSFLCALRSLAPTVFHNDDGSLIYFAPIARRFATAKAYEEAVRTGLSTHDDLISELSRQIWANSQIASVKYALVRRSIQMLGLSALLCIVALAALIF